MFILSWAVDMFSQFSIIHGKKGQSIKYKCKLYTIQNLHLAESFTSIFSGSKRTASRFTQIPFSSPGISSQEWTDEEKAKTRTNPPNKHPQTTRGRS